MKSFSPRWSGNNVPEAFKSTVGKITSSKLTMFYFLFSLLYCTVQTALSARAFIDNSRPDDVLTDIAVKANARNLSIPVFNGTQLALCASETKDSNYHCNVVWDGVPRNNSVSKTIFARGGQFNVASGNMAPISFATADETQVNLDPSCAWSLNYPIYELVHSKRENVAFLCFQIWVFLMSTIAILNESIPHILASLLTHVLALIWGIFEVIQTTGFKLSYKQVITEGACRGANLLPDLFKIRQRTDIPILAVNFLSLVVACFLTMRLIRLLNWRNFKNVGANLQMNRHRKIMLVLFINIQLSLFFVITFATMLLDMLLNGNLSISASFPVLYKAASILSIVLAIPWMAAGWYAVQYELRLPMFLFLTWALIWLAGFGSMFFSTSFMQEFVHWPFFATIGVMAIILTALSFVLGVACRFNFGKGYLIAKDVHANTPVDTKEKPWDVEMSPHEEEKVAFPAPHTPNLPQFPYAPPAFPPPPPSLSKPKRVPVPMIKAPRLFPFNASSRGGSSNNSRSNTSNSTAYTFRDSASSFGNVGGLNTSSTGHGRMPSALSTPGAGRAQLNRMFSTNSSMYTSGASSAGLDYQDSWSSFGHLPPTQSRSDSV